jgi:hypothetical protein
LNGSLAVGIGIVAFAAGAGSARPAKLRTLAELQAALEPVAPASSLHGVALKPLLGSAFGEVLEVEGTLDHLDENSPNSSGHWSQGKMTILSVGKRTLEKPVEIQAYLTGPTQPGKRIRAKGYEEAGFEGIPREASQDLPEAKAGGFGPRYRFIAYNILSTEQ